MSERAIMKGWYSKDYHYSRHNSTKFWNRVKRIKSAVLHYELYEAGCRLQVLEEQVLKQLKAAELSERAAARGRESGAQR